MLSKAHAAISCLGRKGGARGQDERHKEQPGGSQAGQLSGYAWWAVHGMGSQAILAEVDDRQADARLWVIEETV